MRLLSLAVLTPALFLATATTPVFASALGTSVSGVNAGLAYSGTDPYTSTNVETLNSYTLAITGSTITISVLGNGNGTFPFTDTVIDSAITGVTLVSDTFPFTDTYTFSGDTFTYTSNGLPPYQPSASAVFNFTSSATVVPPSATPEPSSLLLLATGALGVCGAARRRLQSSF